MLKDKLIKHKNSSNTNRFCKQKKQIKKQNSSKMTYRKKQTDLSHKKKKTD